MNKAINGDGWAFKPTTADAPAIWAGEDSIVNMVRARYGENDGTIIAGSIGIIVIFGGMFLAVGSPAGALVICAICGFFLWTVIKSKSQGDWIGYKWRLEADGSALAYIQGAKGEALAGKPPLWSVSLDEVARVESGATVEWQRARDYPTALSTNKSMTISDAEMQVFIFTSDGRRLVVHTANAAREDCGRLAHSIRSYVETQRGNAAPVDGASSPAADGFDL